MATEPMTFMVEGAELMFRNFAGKEGMYNKEGDRNFCVRLDDETAADLQALGWAVKYLKVREEGDTPTPYIEVAVGFKIRPPRIVMMTSKARTNLTEDNVEVLDWADIENADLIARAYHWSNSSGEGIKAYLQSLFITIREDALERKYAINEVDG